MPNKSDLSNEYVNNLADESLPTESSDTTLAKILGSLEHFPTGVVITNEEGLPINYNQLAVDLLGEIPLKISPSEWAKRLNLFLDAGKTLYPVENLLYTVLRGETVDSKEIYHIDHRIQGDKWLSVSAKPLAVADGKTHGAIIYFSDISTLKQSELSYKNNFRKIEAASALQQQITEINNDPLKILNLVVSFAVRYIGDGCIASLLNLPADKLRVVASQHTNPSARKLLYRSLVSQEFGLDTALVQVVRTGEPLLVREVDPNNLAQVNLPNYMKYLDDIGIQCMLVVPIKGRNRILGTLSLLRDRGGKPYSNEDQALMMDMAYRTGFAIDTNNLVNLLRMESSGRRFAEEALELSQARFQSIFASTALAIKLVDMDGKIIETNPAFQNMLGYSEDELKGKQLDSFWHPADAKNLCQLLDKVKDNNLQSIQLEHRLIAKDRSTIWVSVTFTAIKKAEREESLPFIVAIAENITEKKRIEAEMARMKSRLQSHVELERLRLAQELHDGPLQDLYSAIYKIENWGTQEGPGGQEKIAGLKQDLLSIVQGLRSTAKDLRPPALAEFGLEKAIRSYAEEFHEKHPKIDIVLHLAHDGKILPEDIRLILFRIYQHSMMNILRHAEACIVNVTFSFDAEEVRLEIEDNGTGFVVPTNWMELVRQGHYGLAGAVERASLLNGTFTVDSRPGEGTTVRVMIPISNGSESSTVIHSED